MKAASILLALVIVLGFVSEAGASKTRKDTDYTVEVFGRLVGFQDLKSGDDEWGMIWLGPLGGYDILCTATQGLVGFCCILATLVIVPVVLTVRLKKKKASLQG
jgi:hypothetical protein